MELLGGFTPLAVGSLWEFEVQSQYANGHTGHAGSSSGICTIAVLSGTAYPDRHVYHAIQIDSTRRISGYVFGKMDTATNQGRLLFDIEDAFDRISVVGPGIDGDNMLSRIFRSHSFGADKVKLYRPDSESVLAGSIDSVLAAEDSGISSANFQFSVLQGRGIGPLMYFSDFGYSGGLRTGSIRYRLRSFKIGP